MFICDKCGRKFKTMQALGGHVGQAHPRNHNDDKKVEPPSVIEVTPELIPGCIFTDPEIASVGITDKAAIEKGIKPKISKFDFLGSGMARIFDKAEGFIKIVSNSETGEILGTSVIGPHATELIGVFIVAVQSRLGLPQLKRIIFAHPTLSESIHAAARN